MDCWPDTEPSNIAHSRRVGIVPLAFLYGTPFCQLMTTSFATMLLLSLACSSPALAQNVAKGCIAEHYSLIALPLHPTRINDRGQVSGTTPTRKAALWSRSGGLRVAAVPTGYTIAEGTGLNSAGHLIGVATNEDGSERRAFTFIGGKRTLLPGKQSRATAINDADEITGEAMVEGKSAASPVLWRNGALIDLGACCGGTAFAVNDRGQVAGQIYDKDGHYHAFLWDVGAGLQTIGVDEDYSASVAINKAGHVAVQAFPHTYLYQDEKASPLQLSPKYPSQPRGLNDCDVIVGSFGKHSDDSKAFVQDSVHGFIDLNERVLSAAGWKLEVASSINNRGEIVGWGDFKGDEDQGFLL